MYKYITHYLLASILFLLVSLSLSGQSVTGYSTLDWDSSTSTLSGYSETELDYETSAYYSAYVRATITDQNGTVIASGSAEDNVGDGSIELRLSATGNTNSTYTLVSVHEGLTTYSDCAGGGGGLIEPRVTTGVSPQCSGPTEYEDYYNFESFLATDSEGYDYSYNWFGPGPAEPTEIRALPVGETFDVVELATPPTCGDQRDQVAAEYSTYQADIRPPCTVFSDSASTTLFTFSQLNYPSPKTAPATYSYGLFTLAYLAAVEQWDENWLEGYSSSGLIINSGYRCPSQNQQAGGAGNSQHMHGDAADMRNVTGDVNGRNLLISAAASTNPGYTEPQSGPCALACVHEDWRNLSQAYSY